MKNIKILLVALLVVTFNVNSLTAQKHNHCSSVSPSSSEKNTLEVLMKKYLASPNAKLSNTGTTCIPIKIHDIRDDNGNGAVNMDSLNMDIANLNHFFQPANIEFYICGSINTLNSSTYYYYDKSTEESGIKTMSPMASNAFNLYLVKSFGTNTAGYAYFPFNSLNSLFCVIDKDVLARVPHGTIVHEYGHHFNLYHTFEGTENGNTDAAAENVPRTGANANCSTDGDLLCDTEANPDNTGAVDAQCNYNGGGSDINGVPYAPQTDNIMSYFPDACGGNFTSNQYSRIGAALAIRLGHSNYSLDCSPAVVPAASGLSGAFSNGKITLTWTDNASNELGYIIERSETSSSSDFRAVKHGGVGPNKTTFADTYIANNTTYWYRIKASNGNCNTYSDVTQVTSGLSYCSPTIYQACANAYISNVKAVGQTTSIDNTTACNSANTDYTASLSADVVAGKKYYMSISQNSGFGRYGQIFIDFNHDGDFNDTGEKMLADNVSVNTASACSDSVAIPANAINGNTRMRVVIASITSDGTIITACDEQNFGESEDYTLVVSGGVTISNTLDQNETSFALQFAPNPTQGYLDMHCFSPYSGEGQLHIRSSEGLSVLNKSLFINSGYNDIQLDITHLAPGIYFAELMQNNRIYRNKIIKY